MLCVPEAFFFFFFFFFALINFSFLVDPMLYRGDAEQSAAYLQSMGKVTPRHIPRGNSVSPHWGVLPPPPYSTIIVPEIIELHFYLFKK